jgi:predicted ATP-binding protein involved in virulence
MFPNIQFILSTHSPFVISSIKNAVVYDLENQQCLEDVSAYSYEGIVEYYFNADMYSGKIKRQ